MGVNLSRGAPIKYYSSDRITQLIGHGLLTFIHKDTNFSNFFSKNEVVFYSNINDLSEKIQKFAVDEKLRKKIAKNGKNKYMKHFNSTVVADYIIKKTFNTKYKKNTFLWDKKSFL
jgi:spore maturation protein CgeB